jgi:hypothetical protein
VENCLKTIKKSKRIEFEVFLLIFRDTQKHAKQNQPFHSKARKNTKVPYTSHSLVTFCLQIVHYLALYFKFHEKVAISVKFSISFLFTLFIIFRGLDE